MNNKYVEIGKVVNTFGIKGELKIQSESGCRWCIMAKKKNSNS